MRKKIKGEKKFHFPWLSSPELRSLLLLLLLLLFASKLSSSLFLIPFPFFSPFSLVNFWAMMTTPAATTTTTTKPRTKITKHICSAVVEWISLNCSSTFNFIPHFLDLISDNFFPSPPFVHFPS